MVLRPFSLLCVILCAASCAPDLKPTSSLISHDLVHDRKKEFDGIWVIPPTPHYHNMHHGRLYFSPLDTSLIKDKYPEEAALLQTQMHDLIVRKVGEALVENNKKKHVDWHLADSPGKATLIVEMQIVKLEPTKGGVNLLGFIGSFFSPVPGTTTVLSQFTKGSIGIEGRIYDPVRHRSIFEFKDTNKDKTLLFSFNDYGRFGHSEENMEKWADALAELIRKSAQVPTAKR